MAKETKKLAKFIEVQMPDGSVWRVPAEVIADNRANYYAVLDKHTTYDEEYQVTISDDRELLDWAAGNMDWADVKAVAVKVKDPAPLGPDQFQEGWVNGEKRVVGAHRDGE